MLEATAAAEIVVGVVSIVDVAEVAPVADRVVDIGVEVVGVAEQAEHTTLGSRAEVQKAQSRIVGDQRERRGFAVEAGRIAEVAVNRIVVVANEVCWGLVGGAGIEGIVVDIRRLEELAEGRVVEYTADAG